MTPWIITMIVIVTIGIYVQHYINKREIKKRRGD